MPKGPRKFHFSFVKTGLTRFGGLCLFQQFCKSLHLRHFLQLSVRFPSYHPKSYHPADLFLSHVMAIVAGIGRIENTQALIHNGLIPPLLGLSDFPHRDTLRTFLWRFESDHLMNLKRAHDKLRTHLFQRLALRYSAIVDADTTALLVYGRPEGSARGYVPKRRHGQASYSPILSSEGQSGLSLDAELRPGNWVSSTCAGDFLWPVLSKLPSSIAVSRTRVRLDGGFYDNALVSPLEEAGIGFCIVAHMTKPLRNRMVEARYHEFKHGWEAAEFSYTPFYWKHECRFVAVRRPKTLEPEDMQQRLFTSKDHTYHRVLVTNLALTPESVWRFYCDRGNQELLIREFKDAYAMAKIPTRSFYANAVYLEMILWAYDLVLAFCHLCLPKEVSHWNIATLRRNLWWLPAEWVKRKNRNILRLPKRYPHQVLFMKIQHAAQRVKPLT